jgi:hypothetical protein
MSSEYRISLWCGALPLASGVSIFALWCLTRAEFLARAGLALLGSGWMVLVVGVISLLLHVCGEHSRDVVSRRRLVRQGLFSGGLLLANFPAAAAVLVAAAWVATTTYTVNVQNQSRETVSHCRLTGGGVEIDLGTLPPGTPATRRLQFSDDGALVLRAHLGDRALEARVESYVTGGLGGDTTVTIGPGGSIDVNRNNND